LYFCLVFVIIPTIKSFAADLPVIEMPQYIITGIEQATALTGKKIPPENSAKFVVPEVTPDLRPLIPLNIVVTPDERLGLLRPVGGGFTEAQALVGSFGKVLANGLTASESLTTGYKVETGFERFPMRTESGPELEWRAAGNSIHWLGSETTFSPKLFTIYRSFQRRVPTGSVQNSLLEIGLKAGSSPISLFDGSLAWLFQVDLQSLDDRRELSASHDLLQFDYSRNFKDGWLDLRAKLEIEAVSHDRASHSLYLIESIYSAQFDHRLLWRAGLVAYTGGSIATPVQVSPGVRESRSGAGILAGLTYKMSPVTTIDVDVAPRPRFESFGEVFAGQMVLDSTARGVTVEKPVAITARLRNRINQQTQISANVSYSSDRHRPFLTTLHSGDWSIVTRKASIISGQIEVEVEPTERLGVRLYTGVTTVSSEGFDPGSNAPFITPFNIGGDLLWSVGRFMVENEINWEKGTEIDFNSDSHAPDRLNWDATVHLPIKAGLNAKAGILNVLNRRHWRIPGYDEAPLTLFIGIDWHGRSALW